MTLLLLLAGTLVSLCTAQYQTEPRRAYSKPGGSVTILGRAGIPLSNCEFYHFPNPNQRIDLSFGSGSPSNADYEYFGAGLERGECGIKLKRVREDNDGVVESKVRSTGGEWQSAATTLRVTTLDKSALPVFEMNPHRADLAVGDSLTVTCNTNRPITLCHIYLPGGILLAYNQGASSASSATARYHGSGLARGHCGTRLTGIDMRLNGYIVCKVGDWPESTAGAWETEALHITTRAQSSRPFTEPTIHFSSDQTCPPVIEPNLELSCSYEGVRVNCNKPMQVGTVVDMRCKDSVHQLAFNSYDAIRCTDNAKWDNPAITCDPDCGRRNSGRPHVSNGVLTEEGEFPWHVAIYKRISSRNHSLQCGGSLLTPSLVVTAAHCFWDQQRGVRQEQESYRIVAGKQRRGWFEGQEKFQRRNISELKMPDRFVGEQQNYAEDIAIIKVSRAYELTLSVNVVCLDWRRDTDKDFRAGVLGIVPGWGLNENDVESTELHHVELPYVPYEDCMNLVRVDFRRYLTRDKLCGGYVNRNVSVCPGDSGGGYVFPVPTPRGSRYYLKGIVSVGSRLTQQKCDASQLAGFTTVSDFIGWLTKTARQLDPSFRPH